MQQFTEKYAAHTTGTLSGFDRLVFRGSPRRLNYSYYDPSRDIVVARGMEEFLWQNGVLFKHYGDYVHRVSERVKQRSLEPFRTADLPYLFLRDPHVDKDLLARRVAAERQIHSGLVCAISTMEPSPTFDYAKSRIARRTRPAHVLYHYQIHPQLGWMYARMQTWFPFNIQVGINGREWLAQQLEREGVAYRQAGNCFVWIADYQRAQQLLDQQLQTNWTELLGSFAQVLNPLHEEIFAQYESPYYWTCYQSEWASDAVFRDSAFLRRLMDILTTHGMLSFHSADVLRFFGKRVKRDGGIPANFHGELQISYKEQAEGARVKFWMEGNSAKYYDKAYTPEGNLLRVAETTLNNVQPFRAYRPKEGGPEDDLQWRVMRKGIADLHRRVEISQKTNERLMQALASVDDSHRLEELTALIQQPTIWNKRRVRALRPFGDDQPLLSAIHDGDFLINGLRNRDLQELLYDTPAQTAQEKRRRSAAVSRKLRMLRAHGILHKVPKTHRYQVAPQARPMLVAILTAARTSLQQFNELQRRAA